MINNNSTEERSHKAGPSRGADVGEMRPACNNRDVKSLAFSVADGPRVSGDEQKTDTCVRFNEETQKVIL